MTILKAILYNSKNRVLSAGQLASYDKVETGD